MFSRDFMSENQSVELEVSSSIYFLLMSYSSIASESAGLDILRSVATIEASKRRKVSLSNYLVRACVQ